MVNIVIASIARTPIGKFCGSLSTLKGSELGSIAIKGALSKLIPMMEEEKHLNDNDNDDVFYNNNNIREGFFGNVVSAGMGQAPARQAVLGAGLSSSTICTTVNKVCASGMKSVMLAAQSLECNNNNNNSDTPAGTTIAGTTMMLAGGFESMSNIPHYNTHLRKGGVQLGHTPPLIDGIIHDGLWDVYNNQHMGMCGEKCARDYNISREEQDEYAIESYRRAREAIDGNRFEEIVPVELKKRRRHKDDDNLTIIDTDEEPGSVKLEKLPTLKPAFDRSSGHGTITAANASSLNDGAAALVLMTEQDATERGIKPLARILGYGDAEQDPIDFTTSPALAIQVAMQRASLTLTDVDYHEINEAFSVVPIANMKLLNLDHSKVNVYGGAVSLGHPIGMSGARIIGTLYDVLKHEDGTIGCASICNGGGGASAIVIERMN